MIWLSSACSDASTTACEEVDVPPEVRIAFARSCALSGCHSAFEPAAGLQLDEGSVFELAARQSTATQRPLVNFGAIETSYLALKVMAPNLPAGTSIVGLPMPPVENPTAGGDKATILRWIADSGGATNRCIENLK